MLATMRSRCTLEVMMFALFVTGKPANETLAFGLARPKHPTTVLLSDDSTWIYAKYHLECSLVAYGLVARESLVVVCRLAVLHKRHLGGDTPMQALRLFLVHNRR